jgi:hypothetical protein
VGAPAVGYAIGNEMQNSEIANQQTRQHIESQQREN